MPKSNLKSSRRSSVKSSKKSITLNTKTLNNNIKESNASLKIIAEAFNSLSNLKGSITRLNIILGICATLEVFEKNISKKNELWYTLFITVYLFALNKLNVFHKPRSPEYKKYGSSLFSKKKETEIKNLIKRLITKMTGEMGTIGYQSGGGDSDIIEDFISSRSFGMYGGSSNNPAPTPGQRDLRNTLTKRGRGNVNNNSNDVLAVRQKLADNSRAVLHGKTLSKNNPSLVGATETAKLYLEADTNYRKLSQQKRRKQLSKLVITLLMFGQSLIGPGGPPGPPVPAGPAPIVPPPSTMPGLGAFIRILISNFYVIMILFILIASCVLLTEVRTGIAGLWDNVPDIPEMLKSVRRKNLEAATAKAEQAVADTKAAIEEGIRDETAKRLKLKRQLNNKTQELKEARDLAAQHKKQLGEATDTQATRAALNRQHELIAAQTILSKELLEEYKQAFEKTKKIIEDDYKSQHKESLYCSYMGKGCTEDENLSTLYPDTNIKHKELIHTVMKNNTIVNVKFFDDEGDLIVVDQFKKLKKQTGRLVKTLEELDTYAHTVETSRIESEINEAATRRGIEQVKKATQLQIEATEAVQATVKALEGKIVVKTPRGLTMVSNGNSIPPNSCILGDAGCALPGATTIVSQLAEGGGQGLGYVLDSYNSFGGNRIAGQGIHNRIAPSNYSGNSSGLLGSFGRKMLFKKRTQNKKKKTSIFTERNGKGKRSRQISGSRQISRSRQRRATQRRRR